MKGTSLSCGHLGQVIVVMTIYCEKENCPLQFCNSEDLRKFRGSHHSHVINV